MATIEVFDGNEGPLSFDLVEILAAIEPFVSGLDWYFLEFEPVASLGVDSSSSQGPPGWVSSLYQQITKDQTVTKIECKI
jgi:hypothetical protein